MLTNETLLSIRKRRSIRAFLDRQIEDEQLKAILDAGSCAPCANDRPRHFTVIQNRDRLDGLNREARELARDFEPLQWLANTEGFHIFYHAPTVIVVSAAEGGIAMESDCAAATENMLLAAQSLGLGSCWIGFLLVMFSGPKAGEYARQLGIPNGYRPCAAAAFGHKGAEAADAPKRKDSLIQHIR